MDIGRVAANQALNEKHPPPSLEAASTIEVVQLSTVRPTSFQRAWDLVRSTNTIV